MKWSVYHENLYFLKKQTHTHGLGSSTLGTRKEITGGKSIQLTKKNAGGSTDLLHSSGVQISKRIYTRRHPFQCSLSS
jgi:hypothetical protein